MAEKLKEIYFNDQFLNELGDAIYSVQPEFDKDWFLQLVYDDGWEEKELKARMRHVTECLNKALSGPYLTVLEILKKVAPRKLGKGGCHRVMN